MEDEEFEEKIKKLEKEEVEKTIKAGRILSKVREESRSWAKPGMLLEELAEKIESAIRAGGAECAFPANLSINSNAAHYTPQLNDPAVIGENDMLKIDIGAHIDGFVADTAYTIDFSGKNENLLQASKNALKSALELCKPGVLISDISSAIEKEIVNLGFKPIENLTGHGLSRYVVHDEPAIPNVAFKSGQRLEEGMILAIEPFSTNGAGRVKDSEQRLIFSFAQPRPVRNPLARKIVDLSGKYHTLPFAERWIQRELGASSFSFRMAMKELLDNEVLRSYPVLREQNDGLVAQFEHTVIVKEEPVVVTE
ncbi:MAG: type II methionyl aminopeptidase [Candidatus Aenigmarchaeota archaeon]|nr:type II methionyl aminopeptidase [Candidatus Aenigmarchaeota archaeon]